MKKTSFVPLVGMVNEEPLQADSNSLRPGVIALANEERFTAAHYSEPLTNYITGWRDSENLQALLDFIAPPVPVGRRFEFKQALNSEAFLSEVDDIRAIGEGFKRVEYKAQSVNAKTINKGLTYVIDLDEEGPVINEELIVQRLTVRILRNELRRGLTALLALDGAPTAVTWSNPDSTPTPQPDEDMRQALATAQLASGVFPNRAVIGLVGWNLRASGYSAQLTAGAIASIGQNPQQVAQKIGLDNMMISRALYQSSSTAKTRVLGSSAVLFYGQDTVGKDDPTHLKRFYTPTGAGLFRVFRSQPSSKFVHLSVEHYSNVVATATVGAKQLNIS